MGIFLLLGSLLNLVVGLTAIIMGIQNVFTHDRRLRGVMLMVAGIGICLLTMALFGGVF